MSDEQDIADTEAYKRLGSMKAALQESRTEFIEAEKNYGADPWRAPKLDDSDILMYSECGRIIKAGTYGHGSNGIDYRSHYFRVVKGEMGYGCFLLVKHGGGQERVKIDYSAQRCVQFFDPLDSNSRYLLMHMLYSVHSDAKRAESDKYRAAFVGGSLKKKRVAGTGGKYRVWIESAAQSNYQCVSVEITEKATP